LSKSLPNIHKKESLMENLNVKSLRKAFNGASESVRLVTLLSPT